jgi:predicted DsbA family dithiol-disulfide isomerase
VVRVEIVLDLVCSWSYLAVTRFNRALAAFRAQGGEAEVTFLPFQLAPGAPHQPMPLLVALGAAFGQHAVAETRRVAAIAARDGLTLNFGQAIANNTFEAHRLVHVAAGQGRAEPVVVRLFRAHFTDGLDIGDAATLKRLAAEAGVGWSDDGADEVRALMSLVRGNGISGVPVFTFGDAGRLTGAQSEDALFAALARGGA